MPNCKYNNSNYRIDFETPIKSPFPDEYKYNGIDNTALLSLDEDNSQKNLDNNFFTNNQAQHYNLEGILFLKNIYWCKHNVYNKNIQLEIYDKFQFLNENSTYFLTHKSNYDNFLKKINTNNYNDFYLFNDEFTFNNFVIDNNNEFAVIIRNIYIKNFKKYGFVDSLVFLSIMHRYSKELNLETNIINFLNKKIKEYYNNFIEEELKIFEKDYKKLNEYIITII
jgi:hypothetical protein